VTDAAALATVAPREAPRLSRIEVTDFRAFPASCPGDFKLGDRGCNLLVFGQNGAGKSSLYRALRDLFSVSPPAIADLHNVFSDLPAPSVRVTLTDGSVLTWTSVNHPTTDVVDVARRSAFLTYTGLRELIYNPGKPNEPLDLFQTAVDNLIGDFEATLEGGIRRSVGELWQDVNKAFGARVTTARGTRRPQHYIRDVETACTRFNEGMRQALDRLDAGVKVLLRRLLDVLSPDPLTFLGFVYTPIVYREDSRKIDRPPLVASVRVRAYQPPAPQNFLNEGRQTALAIAIYLAGRLVCVPSGRDRLKLLVMDDLLISLDASHRRPVLEVILDLFKDWQIILLTHDRYWYELAREQLTADWKAVEMFEGRDGDGLFIPVVRPVATDLAEAVLAQAEAFLANHHPAAAANYARSACELILKRYCIERQVKFPYFEEGTRRPTLHKMLEIAMNQSQSDKPRFSALKALKLHKRFVLNPYSHDPTNPVPSADVAAAIEAVREVGKACSETSPPEK